jgi:hypothetical protein
MPDQLQTDLFGEAIVCSGRILRGKHRSKDRDTQYRARRNSDLRRRVKHLETRRKWQQKRLKEDPTYRELRNKQRRESRARKYADKRALAAQAKASLTEYRTIDKACKNAWREAAKVRRLEHAEQILQQRRQAIIARYRWQLDNNPACKLKHYLRKSIRSRIQRAAISVGKKSRSRLFPLVGCSITHLMRYIEQRFKPGMAWNNYGRVWHIDHIRPCSSFNLLKPSEQKKCFHYTNLQPLFAQENLSKNRKRWRQDELFR